MNTPRNSHAETWPSLQDREEDPKDGEAGPYDLEGQHRDERAARLAATEERLAADAEERGRHDARHRGIDTTPTRKR